MGQADRGQEALLDPSPFLLRAKNPARSRAARILLLHPAVWRRLFSEQRLLRPRAARLFPYPGRRTIALRTTSPIARRRRSKRISPKPKLVICVSIAVTLGELRVA